MELRSSFILLTHHLDASALAALVLLTIGVLGTYIYWRGYPTPLKDIPYNKESARNWKGDIPDYIDHIVRTGEGWDWMSLQCQKLKSPIVQVFLGPYQKPTVVLVDHAEIRDISTRRLGEFDRGGFLAKWFGLIVPHGSIVMPTDARFRAHRAIWQGTMSGEFVNRVFAPQIQRTSASLVKQWTTKLELAQGKPFEANVDVRTSTFEVIWTATFGDELNLMEQQSYQDLERNVHILDDEAVFPALESKGIFKSFLYLLDTLEATRVSLFPFLQHWFLKQSSDYKKFNQTKKQHIQSLLAESKAKFDSQAKDGSISRVNSVMDFVYQRQKDKAGKLDTTSDLEMEDELMTLLVGGYESSTWNMSWGLKYLSQNQSAQAALHAELSAAFPGANNKNLPSANDITSANLPYMNAVIEETLRLARTNAGALRITTKDTQIYGYFIPKGTDLFAVHSGESAVIEQLPRPNSLKTRSNSWEPGTLADFKPERWIKQDAAGRKIFDPQAGPFMAFGSGVRGCFGQRLARTTMLVTMVTLFIAFDFEFIDGDKASFAAQEKLVRMARSTYVQLKVRHRR